MNAHLLPDIDPGTVPPLKGPGVVAGWYTLRRASIGLGWMLDLVPADSRVTPDGEDHAGEISVWLGIRTVCTWGVGEPDEPLRLAAERLRAKLDGVVYGPHHFERATLTRWLRELNLHPCSVRDALEAT